MLRWVAADAAPASGRTTQTHWWTPRSLFKQASLIFNGHWKSFSRCQRSTGRAGAKHLTLDHTASGVEQRGSRERKSPPDASAGGDRMHPSVRWQLGLAMCLRHLHRTLTHYVRSLRPLPRKNALGAPVYHGQRPLAQLLRARLC
jgi:hypothetical protein